jgi:riboflavin biosynthesis pyrimidine reductase
VERLHPEHGAVEVADAYGDLRLEELTRPGRPYTIANMIASADGRVTVGGRSGELGGDADREVFLDLRTQVDAVMAGTATIGIEGYGPLIRSTERKERRMRRGLSPVPLAVTATRTMELPAHAPLFQDPGSSIVVLTSSDREPPPCPARVVVERIPGDPLDFLAGMERLRNAHGVRSVLLEGGPTLLGAMIAAGVVDELFLTVSPKLVGRPDEPSLLEGPALREPVALALLSVLHDDGHLFLRYRLGVA